MVSEKFLGVGTRRWVLLLRELGRLEVREGRVFAIHPDGKQLEMNLKQVSTLKENMF